MISQVTDKEDFLQGVVFYCKEGIIVGIVLWNIFGRGKINAARQVSGVRAINIAKNIHTDLVYIEFICMRFKNSLFSQGVQIDLIFTDNVCIFYLSCIF